MAHLSNEQLKNLLFDLFASKIELEPYAEDSDVVARACNVIERARELVMLTVGERFQQPIVAKPALTPQQLKDLINAAPGAMIPVMQPILQQIQSIPEPKPPPIQPRDKGMMAYIQTMMNVNVLAGADSPQRMRDIIIRQYASARQYIEDSGETQNEKDMACMELKNEMEQRIAMIDEYEKDHAKSKTLAGRFNQILYGDKSDPWERAKRKL